MERRRVGQEVFLRRGSDGRSHGIQQTLVLNFTHHALRVPERTISKYFCVQIEVIDQIVSNFSIGAHLVTAVFIPEEE
jgi:hypothetical protein